VKTSRPILLLVLVLLAACTPRGPLLGVPDGAAPGKTIAIFQGSNRTYGVLEPPRKGRALANRYDRIDVRVPDYHAPGEVRIPATVANPATQFLVSDSRAYRSEAEFTGALRTSLAALPPDEREIVVFVPGFNMSAAQSLARVAQLRHDLDLPGITALYSWPSAGSVLGYAYDRDSILASREAFADFLRAVVKSRARRVIVVAHSMGALLTMETLRSLSLENPGWPSRNLGGVVLLSPDIDVDVFREQAARIGPLPSPFAIFVSENDRALALSARVSGDGRRLGNVTDPGAFADLDVVLIDVSHFSSGMGHFDIGRSPALIGIVGRMAEIELSFHDDPAARAGLISGTILTVQNATQIVLSPIAE
jgi:esterase/lipase superfamily enzyme